MYNMVPAVSYTDFITDFGLSYMTSSFLYAGSTVGSVESFHSFR
jgi:hypothetical protein